MSIYREEVGGQNREEMWVSLVCTVGRAPSKCPPSLISFSARFSFNCSWLTCAVCNEVSSLKIT